MAGKVPCYRVYEDSEFLAFLDIRPLTVGNCLVIPKKHYTWTYEVPDFGRYFEVAKKVGLRAREILGAEWISFLTLGTEVPHAHIRVIPRYPGDLHGEGVDITKFEKLSESQMEEIAGKMREGGR